MNLKRTYKRQFFGMKKRLHKATTPLWKDLQSITIKQVNIKNQPNGTENIPKNELNGATSALIGKIKTKGVVTYGFIKNINSTACRGAF